MFWRGVAFLEGGCSVLEGCGIVGGPLQSFGGVWHFWRMLAVLQRFGGAWFLEKPLAVVWRGVAFLEDACSVWRGVAFWRSRLQCFGGAWHFGEAACSVLEWQEELVQHFGGAC